MLILPFILPFFHYSVCSVTFPRDFPHETPPNPKPSPLMKLFGSKTGHNRQTGFSSRRRDEKHRERQRGGTATRHPHQHQLRYSLLSGAASLSGESFVRKYTGLVSARAHLCLGLCILQPREPGAGPVVFVLLGPTTLLS